MIIDEKFLKDKIAELTVNRNESVTELVQAENFVEQLKKTVSATDGSIQACVYMLEKVLDPVEFKLNRIDPSGIPGFENVITKDIPEEALNELAKTAIEPYRSMAKEEIRIREYLENEKLTLKDIESMTGGRVKEVIT